MTGSSATDVSYPTFTNAHAQMCAVISAVVARWGDVGESLLRRTYRELGHHTGLQMLETGVVDLDASLEDYARVSEQIMDTCGLAGWSRVESDVEEHRTVVPGCAAYKPLFEFIGAPANICEIPFEWDNGCLDAINPSLEIWPSECAYSDKGSCHYVLTHRTETGPRAPTVGPELRRAGAAGIAVQDEPTWTNPTAGFIALVGSVAATHGSEGVELLRVAMHALGEKAGSVEGQDCASDDDVTKRLANRYRAAGFGVGRTIVGTTESVVELGANPYRPVLDHFASREVSSVLFAAYDQGWAQGVGSAVAVAVRSDSWANPDLDHSLALSFR